MKERKVRDAPKAYWESYALIAICVLVDLILIASCSPSVH
jgi:hypothetical protein